MQLVSELGFYQGDEARELFEVMYPKGKSAGGARQNRMVIDEMLMMTSDDRDAGVRELDTSGMSGQFRTKDHILVWNYAFSWIALYAKVTKKSLVKAV